MLASTKKWMIGGHAFNISASSAAPLSPMLLPDRFNVRMRELPAAYKAL